MAATDFIILLLCFLFVHRGASQGFLRSLSGPFSMIAATFVSVVYYQHTGNMAVSLGLGLISPLVFSLLYKLFLGTWSMATHEPSNPSLLSSLGGAALCLAWGCMFIFLGLLFLVVLPPWGKTLTAVHKDVTSSVSYSLVRPFKDLLFAFVQNRGPAVTPAATAPLGDVKLLAHDPRFQAVLRDAEVQKEIQGHDIMDLMRNPKMMGLVRQIMDDPEAMKKVMAIYSSQSSQPLTSVKNP